jgi:excisionase family DNA binding protein
VNTTSWDQLPLVLTADQVAELTGLGRNATYAALADGTIPSLRVGRRILIARDALRELLERGAGSPSPAPAELQADR